MLDAAAAAIRTALDRSDLAAASDVLTPLNPDDIVEVLYRLSDAESAVTFRLLAKDRALAVFEDLDADAQRELVERLGDAEVAAVFSGLHPEDRVKLLEEVPAKVAKRLVQQLSPAQRELTASILGYPVGSVGRRMSPEFTHVYADETVGSALHRVTTRVDDHEHVSSFPVIDARRRVVGLIGLSRLVTAPATDVVEAHAAEPVFVLATDDGELAARECLEQKMLALPIVDGEHRLVGVLPLDDAAEILDEAASEDAARAGASEPLRRPYLLTSVFSLAKSRVVWLLVLAVSAILTVNVLEIFEATLEQMVALALFIPLLTGIGGNTGSQAATTVTRALAMGDASVRDIGTVAFKESRTGLLLGALLGAVGFAVATIFYGYEIGLVIGLTVIAVCIMAATVGGAMPLIAKAIRVDPAVFSTPFISTFCDAVGLIIYFSIAKAILGI